MEVEFIQPRKPSYRLWAMCGLILFSACAVWLGVAWQAHERTGLIQKIEDIQKQKLRLINGQQNSSVSSAAATYKTQAQKVWSLGRFDTQAALSALEGVAIPGISISKIEIDANHNAMNVEFDASNFSALGTYMDQLNERSAPLSWSLLSVSTNSTEIASVPSQALHATMALRDPRQRSDQVN